MDAEKDAEAHPEEDADVTTPATTDVQPTPTAAPPSQLRLLDAPAARDWRLDESTREVGRRGIVLARQALDAARRRDAARDERQGASTAA